MKVAEQYEVRALRHAGEVAWRTFRRNPDKRMVRSLLWQAQDGRCASCDTPMVSRLRDERSGDRDTIDHVWPRGKMGGDVMGNLALMHHKCNQLKDSRLPNEFEIAALKALNDKLGWPTRSSSHAWAQNMFQESDDRQAYHRPNRTRR